SFIIRMKDKTHMSAKRSVLHLNTNSPLCSVPAGIFKEFLQIQLSYWIFSIFRSQLSQRKA
ncbi:hypothetical protein, partial [Neobacillus fumarioli]|uniref:hypothetical protein n=1 Tax=Neobacillus fumarioli TaxID=105229 RepID=UPI001C3F45A5